VPRDTFKTTYEATKDSSVAGVDVAGFFSTCDYCQPCQDSEGKMVSAGQDEANVFINGQTEIRFFPHINDKKDANGQIIRRPTEFINSDGTTSPVVTRDNDGNINNTFSSPTWEDGGGFYYKRRTGYFRIGHHNPSFTSGKQKICNYLMEVDWTASLDNQILNWFKGGPDRMAFLVLSRHTDKQASYTKTFPAETTVQAPLQQYFHFLSNSGSVGGSGLTGAGIDSTSHSGKFYFYARPFDVFWIEFYEYARRGFPQNTMRDSREKQQKNADGTQNSCQRVDYASDPVDQLNLVVNKDAGDAFGPGISHPPVNWSYGQEDADKFYFFSKGNSDERNVQTYNASPLPELRSMGVEARPNRQTFEEGDLDGFANSSLKFNRLGSNGIDNFLQRYKFPPTLGHYSFYDINLGLADPLNHDWVQGNYLDPDLTNRDNHNNVKVKIKRHLAVHPSFTVLDGYDVGDKNLAFAPYMESSVNLDYVNAIGDLKTDSKVGGKSSPYGPNSPRTQGRFDKQFANDQSLSPRPGFLLENAAEET
tara:strand:- start:2532 stop:4133 length:1602 start_codon:yes stop_codon:yes gene_type:complete